MFSESEKSPPEVPNVSSTVLVGENESDMVSCGVNTFILGVYDGADEVLIMFDDDPSAAAPGPSPILLQKSRRIVFSGTRYQLPCESTSVAGSRIMTSSAARSFSTSDRIAGAVPLSVRKMSIDGEWNRDRCLVGGADLGLGGARGSRTRECPLEVDPPSVSEPSALTCGRRGCRCLARPGTDVATGTACAIGGDGSSESDEVDDDDERGAEMGGNGVGTNLGDVRGVLDGVDSRDACARQTRGDRGISVARREETVGRLRRTPSLAFPLRWLKCVVGRGVPWVCTYRPQLR